MEHVDFLRAPTAVIAGACVSVVAIFSEYWMQNNLGQHAGLWNWCDENLGTCVAVDDVNKSWEDPYLDRWIHTARVYSMVSLVLMGITFLLASCAYKYNSTEFSVWSSIYASLQALVLIAALLMFLWGTLTCGSTGVIKWVSWSYALAWAGVALYLLGAATFMWQAKQLGFKSSYKTVGQRFCWFFTIFLISVFTFPFILFYFPEIFMILLIILFLFILRLIFC